MNYEIIYNETSGDWLIFDVGESFELLSIHGSKEDAQETLNQLMSQTQKKARWSKEKVAVAA
mgnify:FL=1